MYQSSYNIHDKSIAALPVMVWGTDPDGEIFREEVAAEDLTPAGAQLTGIVHSVAMGDLIGLQYKERKVHARVIAVRRADRENEWILRVQLLQTSRCPWNDLELCRAPAAAPKERRRFRRHPIGVALDVRTGTEQVPMYASTTDISEGGCYIEALLPLPQGTLLNIAMWLGPEAIVSSAVVRTCDMGVGMGIEFTGLTDETRELLSCYLHNQVERGQPARDNAQMPA